MKTLQEHWNITESSHSGTHRFFFLSPSHYSIFADFIPVFKKYIHGDVLDAGAGRLGWKHVVLPYCRQYFSLDACAASNLDIVGDITTLPLVDNSFDTILCLQVLEHTPQPACALKEIGRVLKPGGRAIISFPHLSYIHGQPHDYFRYTRYGFESICPDNLILEECKENGGLLCFISIPFFIVLHAVLHQIPGLRTAAYYLGKILSIFIYHLDACIKTKKQYPVNYIAVLTKRP